MKCMAPESRKKKPGKGGKKPSKCPSIEDIAEEVAKEMSDEICIFQELGWMDADWNEDEAMYMADIASLPSNVSAALDSDDDFEECYMEVEACMNEKFNKDKKMKVCTWLILLLFHPMSLQLLILMMTLRSATWRL